jgi:hypothetical protein
VVQQVEQVQLDRGLADQAGGRWRTWTRDCSSPKSGRLWPIAMISPSTMTGASIRQAGTASSGYVPVMSWPVRGAAGPARRVGDRAQVPLELPAVPVVIVRQLAAQAGHHRLYQPGHSPMPHRPLSIPRRRRIRRGLRGSGCASAESAICDCFSQLQYSRSLRYATARHANRACATYRLTGALSRRGPAGAVNIVSPLHLHKGSSRANETMLAAVPPCAG